MNEHIEIIVDPTHKGGAGKTFLLRLLYQAIARVLRKNNEYRKILVIDSDGQANTSERWVEIEYETLDEGRMTRLGKMPPPHPDLEGERSDISDLWLKGVAPVPYETLNPRIDVVPARECQIAQINQTNLDAESVLLLREWLSSPEISEKYCAVFIDTPPNRDLMTQAAVAAATQVFVPMKFEPHPIAGVASMIHLIDSEAVGRNGEYPDLNFLGIVGNDIKTTNTTLYKQYKAALQDHPHYSPHLFPVELKHLTAFAQTDARANLPGDVFDYPSKNYSHVLKLSQEFCEAMFRRMTAFSEWDLDFRKGESFALEEEYELEGKE